MIPSGLEANNKSTLPPSGKSGSGRSNVFCLCTVTLGQTPLQSAWLGRTAVYKNTLACSVQVVLEERQGGFLHLACVELEPEDEPSARGAAVLVVANHLSGQRRRSSSVTI